VTPSAPVIGGFFFLLFLCAPAAADEYDGWMRHSVYVPVTDGTRIAVDYYRPTAAGQLHEKSLPVVWRFTPYGRYLTGQQSGTANALPQHGAGLNGPAALETLLNNGYVVAVADIRGYGASFGVSETWLGPQQAEDARDITNWLAAQSWSSGKVGMMGLSYLGSVQYLAASKASPHLRAIFAAMAQFDHYETFMLNGIYRQDLAPAWRSIRSQLDHDEPDGSSPVARVTSDSDRALIRSAMREHKKNRDLGEQMAPLQFRDSADALTGRRWHIENSLWNYLEDVEKSGVALYHWTGWWDSYAGGQILAFANLDNPQKLHIGPYFHSDHFGVDIYQESLRWFDYWLKGVKNGVMDEPAVRFFIAGDEPATGWRHSATWPPGNTVRKTLYLSEENLAFTPSPSVHTQDAMAVDYSISLGSYLDRNNGSFRAQDCADRTDAKPVCYRHSGYPDLALDYDARALSYTSAPLETDVLVAGRPVVHLWVTASTEDADFFVVLEEIEADGTSRFVTDNAIRASHRAVNEPPFDNLGAPWHGNYEADAAPLPPHPVEIVLALKPAGNRFEKGNRVRLTIAGADASSGSSGADPVPRVFSVHKGENYPSRLELTVIAR
jgi:putative CocE/NonD family hydrolase